MRNRHLAKLGRALSTTEPDILERTLAAKGPGAKVLELGFGEGRALLELAARFPEAKFYGVDRSRFGPDGAGDLRWTAQQYGIDPPEPLPELFFYRFGVAPERAQEIGYGRRLHFETRSLDLIYSAVVIRFVHDKVSVLEEACRTLKVGGTALLQIDDTQALDDTSRLVIQTEDGVVPLVDHLAARIGDAYEVRLIHPRRLSVEITKLAPVPLDLGLDFEGYVPRRAMPTRDGVRIGGRRSLYRVRDEESARRSPSLQRLTV